jgi:hypothetical protein
MTTNKQKESKFMRRRTIVAKMIMTGAQPTTIYLEGKLLRDGGTLTSFIIDFKNN